MNLLDRYLYRTVIVYTLMAMGVLLTLGGLFLFISQQSDIGVGDYGAVDAFEFTFMNLPQQAFELLLRWSPRSPTLTEGGDYFELTAALYEGATGKKAGEVVTACAKVLCAAKEDGYERDRPEQYLQRLPWDIPF